MSLAGVTPGGGLRFLISAEVVWTVVAKDCSSPQTAELNAAKRAETLMKWANIGIVESVVFVAIAAYMEPKYAREYAAGAALAMVITYGEYVYAKSSGLNNPGEPTEDWLWECLLRALLPALPRNRHPTPGRPSGVTESMLFTLNTADQDDLSVLAFPMT